MARTVLVVDDDRTLVEMLTFMLKRFGFETRAAYNGLQGLEILHAERIDLVVLDVMLPDVDGFEICRRIRSIPRIGEIPMLMLSACSQVRIGWPVSTRGRMTISPSRWSPIAPGRCPRLSTCCNCIAMRCSLA